MDWSKGKGKPKGKVKSQKNPKGKGYTAEEASPPDSETQDSQWQEPTEPSYDTWETDSQTWDWNLDTIWDDSEAHYQEWDVSQDWQSQSGWLAEQVSSGPECSASGQDTGLLQLFVEDVAQHCFLCTKGVGTIDLAQNPTYAILDLGCTKPWDLGTPCTSS